MEKQMRIEKEYNVQGLADKVKGCIKTACETKSRNVSLDVITAQDVVDVLETVASWENKRTKSRDENKLTRSNKKCFGAYDCSASCEACECKEDCKEKQRDFI